MFISLEGNKDVWMLRACLSSAQSEVIHLDKERNLALFALFVFFVFFGKISQNS